jgi:hypothetical protein
VDFILFYVAFFGAVVYSFSSKGWLMLIGQSALAGYGAFLLIRMTAKFEELQFDNEFLYVFRKKQDILIPLENIESVEIQSLGGVYKVNLYHAEQLGKEFYFKTSLLYPLNYQSKDELVNRLRAAIERAKRKPREYQQNALMS